MRLKIRKLKGANMDIDLASPKKRIHWKQDECPWNIKEKNKKHKCAVKNVSICPYFCGIENSLNLLKNHSFTYGCNNSFRVFSLSGIVFMLITFIE